MQHLPEVRERGFPFVVQYTINGYPRALESSVVDGERAVEAAWRVRELFGPRALVWRYDPIITSSATPAEFHVENFRRLASRLEGATDEVVISFAQVYRKTQRNLDAAARDAGVTWRDAPAEDKRGLLRALVRAAREHRMQLAVCAQRDLLVEGAGDAQCVDARRLSDIAGASLQARLKGNRKDCGCFESRDIGEYDTCPHGCVYCYAVQNRETALRRFRRHDPDSEFLFEPAGSTAESDGPPERRNALPLFKA